MADKIQLKQGPESRRTTVTPDVGEPLFTTDEHKLYIGDGTTPGGVPLTAEADHSHDNLATLDKIGESSGAPTWNGEAWPGGSSGTTSHVHDGIDGTPVLDPAVALDGNKFKANLLPNSSFRLGQKYWSGWETPGWSISLVSSRGDETRLQRTSNNTSGADVEIVSDAIMVSTSGTKLILSADIAGPNVSAVPLKVRLSAYNATDTELAYVEISGETTTASKRYASSVLTIPAGTGYVKVHCICPNGFTQTGGGAAVSRIKVESDNGSGKPTPYSFEADLLKVVPGTAADYSPSTHSHVYASYDETNGAVEGLMSGWDKKLLQEASPETTSNGLVSRNASGESSFTHVWLEDASGVATTPTDPAQAAPKQYVDDAVVSAVADVAGAKVTRYRVTIPSNWSTSAADAWTPVPGMSLDIIPTRDGVLYFNGRMRLNNTAANTMYLSVLPKENGVDLVDLDARGAITTSTSAWLTADNVIPVVAGKTYHLEVRVYQTGAGTITTTANQYAALNAILYENANVLPDPLFVQPGGRVVSSQQAVGVTTNPTTTALILNYILPDPRISVTLAAGHKATVTAQLAIQSPTAGASMLARLMRSPDGGTTWNTVGHYCLAHAPAADYRVPFTLTAVDSPGAGTFIYGISIGNPSGGSNTISTWSDYRILTVTVVDPSTYTPTDVVEYGSNANGEYVKYPDGRLECWRRISLATFTGPANYTTGALTFPVPFLSTPVVTATLENASYSDLVTGPSVAMVSATSVTLAGVLKDASTRQYSVVYCAKGHWK